jgi:hypothetical protein
MEQLSFCKFFIFIIIIRRHIFPVAKSIIQMAFIALYMLGKLEKIIPEQSSFVYIIYLDAFSASPTNDWL